VNVIEGHSAPLAPLQQLRHLQLEGADTRGLLQGVTSSLTSLQLDLAGGWESKDRNIELLAGCESSTWSGLQVLVLGVDPQQMLSTPAPKKRGKAWQYDFGWEQLRKVTPGVGPRELRLLVQNCPNLCDLSLLGCLGGGTTPAPEDFSLGFTSLMGLTRLTHLAVATHPLYDTHFDSASNPITCQMTAQDFTDLARLPSLRHLHIVRAAYLSWCQFPTFAWAPQLTRLCIQGSHINRFGGDPLLVLTAKDQVSLVWSLICLIRSVTKTAALHLCTAR
jgi:hypothetical protein